MIAISNMKHFGKFKYTILGKSGIFAYHIIGINPIEQKRVPSDSNGSNGDQIMLYFLFPIDTEEKMVRRPFMNPKIKRNTTGLI